MSTPDTVSARRGRPPSGGREAILAATLDVLRDRGIAHLTSREVASRAGVSEGSVFYHFGDRVGLLRAAFELAIKPLRFLDDAQPADHDLHTVLAAAWQSLEEFFTDALPVLLGAQSDDALRAELVAVLRLHDYGPHEGVRQLGGYLRAEQRAGRVDAHADVDAAALMLIDGAFSRVTRREMLGAAVDDARLPSVERTLAEVERLLRPPD